MVFVNINLWTWGGCGVQPCLWAFESVGLSYEAVVSSLPNCSHNANQCSLFVSDSVVSRVRLVPTHTMYSHTLCMHCVHCPLHTYVSHA